MSLLPKFHSQNQLQVWLALGLTALLIAIGGMIAFFGPPTLPLWYSLTVSEEQLAPRWWILVIPGLAVLITAISLWFGRHTDLEHESYVAAISIWSGLILLSLLSLATFRILWVVL